MEGTFALLGPLDLLQLLARGNKTGAFLVVAPGGRGAVFLTGNRVTHAEWNTLGSAESVLEILLLREGRFRFIEGRVADRITLNQNLDRYLLQAVRRLDERIEVRPFDYVKFGQDIHAGRLTLNPDELALLTHLSPPVTVLELSVTSGRPLHDVIKILGHLARLGVIEIEQRAPHTAQLKLAIRDPLPPCAHIDELILRAWRQHYGHFDRVYARVGNRTLELPVCGLENLGSELLLGTEQLVMHELSAGQILTIWPALLQSEKR